MSARQEAVREAARQGMKPEYERFGWTEEVRVMAPSGKCWHSDCHEIVVSHNVGPWGTAELWQQVTHRLREGAPSLVPCTAESCVGWEDGRCVWWADDE